MAIIDSIGLMPTLKIEMIGPEVAREYLAKLAPYQRPIIPEKVREYAAAMRRGLWKLTGCIEFNWDGELVQGQQRLNAVIESGATVLMVVMRGVDPDAYLVMDQGAKRRVEHALGIKPLPSQVCKAVMRCSRGVLDTEAGSPERVAHMYVELEPHLDAFFANTHLHSKGRMRTPARAAAVLLIREGAPVGYITDAYNRLAQTPPSDLTPSEAGYWKRAASGEFGGGQTAANLGIALGLRALSPDHRDRKRLYAAVEIPGLLDRAHDLCTDCAIAAGLVG